eukprot:c36932_g1_i1 orf=167-409(-)
MQSSHIQKCRYTHKTQKHNAFLQLSYATSESPCKLHCMCKLEKSKRIIKKKEADLRFGRHRQRNTCRNNSSVMRTTARSA